MLLLIVGLLALLSQIVLLRELNVAFYGVELVYALALAAWLCASAAGALLPWGPTSGRRATAWLLAAASLALPVNVAWIRGSRLALGAIPGAFLPFSEQLLVLLASVVPQAAALGLAFRWAAAESASRGATLARSYAIESAGACLGGLAATLGFLLGVQTFTLALLTAAAMPALLAARATCHATTPRGRTALAALSVAILCGGTAASLGLAPRLDLSMTAWTHRALTASRDSPHARITATRHGSQAAVFVDDVLVHESEGALQEELAHLAALAHPSPRRILLLGGSVTGIAGELEKHAPERLVTVEADRTYVEIGRRLARLPAVEIDDPRRFLRRQPRRFDLVVVATPQPTSGQSNRFYTREFLLECLARLEPGGVVALGLDLPEHVVSPVLAWRAASVVEAARSVFASVQVLRGRAAVVVASPAPLPAGAEPMVERWRERQLSVRLVSPAYLRYLWDEDRRAGLDAMLRRLQAAPNTDGRPVCYQVAAAGWLSKFFPGLLALRPRPWTMAGVLVALVVAGAVAVFVAARSRRASRRTQAALAGFAGMALETVLLLAYQAHDGALYGRLGVLLLAFMLGLAAGAASARRLRQTAAAHLALALLGALVAALVASGEAMGLVGTAILMLAAGGTTAGIFARVSAEAVSQAAEAGPLYAADLAGGAAGSLLAGMILVPSAGLAATAWLVCGAGIAGWVMARR